MTREQAIKFLQGVCTDYASTMSDSGHETAAQCMSASCNAAFRVLVSESNRQPPAGSSNAETQG